MNIDTILAWAQVWNLTPYPGIPVIEETKDMKSAEIRLKFSGIQAISL